MLVLVLVLVLVLMLLFGLVVMLLVVFVFEFFLVLVLVLLLFVLGMLVVVSTCPVVLIAIFNPQLNITVQRKNNGQADRTRKQQVLFHFSSSSG